jgi:hypothetical protein
MSKSLLQDAATLLSLLADGEPVSFQTFGEGMGRHDRSLNRVRTGNLEQHSALLRDLNERGAGVFFMVNRGDGRGRRTVNVEKVRAVFVDLDGAPLEPVMSWALRPHAVVETSPGRFHAYWKIDGLALDYFGPVQRRLAALFRGDPSVSDLPRVMRLPGFEHLKGAPFTSKLISFEPSPGIGKDFLLSQLGELGKLSALPATAHKTIVEGERNTQLFGLARGFVRKGYDRDQVLARMRPINDRCLPPLGEGELAEIVRSASRYGSHGSTRIPHEVLDSPEWRRLPAQSKSIVLMAYRRLNGENNGNISLPYSDFAEECSHATFYKHRKAAVHAGFLEEVTKGRYSELGGKQPDLFRLRPIFEPNRGQDLES